MCSWCCVFFSAKSCAPFLIVIVNYFSESLPFSWLTKWFYCIDDVFKRRGIGWMSVKIAYTIKLDHNNYFRIDLKVEQFTIDLMVWPQKIVDSSSQWLLRISNEILFFFVVLPFSFYSLIFLFSLILFVTSCEGVFFLPQSDLPIFLSLST